MKLPQVYVVQNQHRQDEAGQLKPKFDLTSAEEFGQLSFLLSPTARPFRPAPIIAELHQKLRDFRGDTDYLLLLGNPCIIGWTVAIAAQYSGGRVRLLQWDGRNARYGMIDADLDL